MNAGIDPAAQQHVARELGADEPLLWSGRPMVPGDALMVPFSLMWGGFAIFWEYWVVRGGPLFMKLCGVPFVLIGLYLIFGRFFFDAYRRSHTYYAITTERVLIVSEALGRKVQTLQLAGLVEMDFTEGSDDSGTSGPTLGSR